MKPKKKLIDRAINNGSLERMNKLLSAAQILNCESNNLIEEASDLMAENGLMLGSIKKLHNDFVKSADRYFAEFSKLVTDEKCKSDMFGDLEEFDKSFRKWAKIDVTNLT